jgi:hypothetical protein
VNETNNPVWMIECVVRTQNAVLHLNTSQKRAANSRRGR